MLLLNIFAKVKYKNMKHIPQIKLFASSKFMNDMHNCFEIFFNTKKMGCSETLKKMESF